MSYQGVSTCVLPRGVEMDRSGVLIVVVGCAFMAAAGALVAIKNAKQHEDPTEPSAATAPVQNAEPVVEVPVIEPIPRVEPPAPVPTEPRSNAAAGVATNTGKATPTEDEEGKTVVGGDGSSVQSVVARMGPDFRRCYNNGLQTNPNMKGSLRITARIGPNGQVVVANPSGGNGLSKEVIDCVVARFKSARFSPPEGGGATIVVPVSFVGQ